jgi:hypothetical protein
LKAELEIKNRENKEKEKRILNLIEEIDKKEYSIKDHDQNLSTYKLKIDALDSMVKGLNADKSHL